MTALPIPKTHFCYDSAAYTQNALLLQRCLYPTTHFCYSAAYTQNALLLQRCLYPKRTFAMTALPLRIPNNALLLQRRFLSVVFLMGMLRRRKAVFGRR